MAEGKVVLGGVRRGVEANEMEGLMTIASKRKPATQRVGHCWDGRRALHTA